MALDNYEKKINKVVVGQGRITKESRITGDRE